MLGWLHQVKERVEDASASASGVGSLLKMRQALAKLTAEVKEMTVREGKSDERGASPV